MNTSSSASSQVLYVHGMGRTPLSGWPMLRRLRHSGLEVETFSYFVCAQDFNTIVDRLRRRIERLAERGTYVLIGHSLGGLLLRAAIAGLSREVLAQARRLFLLGSPIYPTTLSRQLRHRALYRLLTGDCGQFLADADRMASIGPAPVPTTAIIGTRGLPPGRGPFEAANDGVILVAEATAPWLLDQARVPIVHTWLPASRIVSDIMLQRLRGTDDTLATAQSHR